MRPIIPTLTAAQFAKITPVQYKYIKVDADSITYDDVVLRVQQDKIAVELFALCRRFGKYRISLSTGDTILQKIDITSNVYFVDSYHVVINCVDPVHDSLEIEASLEIVGNVNYLTIGGSGDVVLTNANVKNILYYQHENRLLSSKYLFHSNTETIYQPGYIADTLVLMRPVDELIFARICETITSMSRELIISPVGGCVFNNYFSAWKCQTM
jgi:hypothetical protein